jgi:hypothetical protein
VGDAHDFQQLTVCAEIVVAIAMANILRQSVDQQAVIFTTGNIWPLVKRAPILV